MSLDSAEGQEYWMAMNLAGDFASACHEVIYDRLHNGKEVIIHRKGTTPASTDVFGIIPGSMTVPGVLVRGKGYYRSINSASHGGGRQMSRTQVIKTITHQEMKAILKDHGVTLIGVGLDEEPMAQRHQHRYGRTKGIGGCISKVYS